MGERFWVFDWLHTLGISDSAAVDRALKDRRIYREFQEAARKIGVEGVKEVRVEDSMAPILAGRGVDLTGDLSCVSRGCLRKQVDELLTHVWHYFDYILLADLTAQIAKTPFKKLNRQYVAGWLEALIYLNEVGASRIARFVNKEYCCDECIEVRAGLSGLSLVLDAKEALLDSLVRRSQIKLIDTSPTDVDVVLRTDGLDGSWTTPYARSWVLSKTKAEVIRDAAAGYLDRALKGLTGDFYSAKLAGVALGSTVAYYRDLLAMAHADSARTDLPGQVAFNLRLPVLENVPISAVLKLRSVEGAVFQNFQKHLRLAIREQIKASDSGDPMKIAKEVTRDLIDPGLAEIRAAVTRNSKSLARDYATLGIGVATATAGALMLNPLVGVFGAAAASSGLNAVLREKHERDSIEARDLYFLFAASQHASDHVTTNSALYLPPNHH